MSLSLCVHSPMARTVDGRVAYADLLRVCAMLAVIVLHVSGGWFRDVPVGSTPWQTFNIYDGLVRWCVPVFVMLSGMFLLDPKRDLPLGKLLFHHILRIGVALVVWGAVYAVVGHLLEGGALTLVGIRNALWSVLQGKLHYHLWFLPMIIGLYLVTPILRAFVRGASRGDIHWFFLLVFLFTFVLPTLLRLRPSQTFSSWQGLLGVKLVLGYVGYYMAGYYLKTYTLGRAAEFIIYALGIAGAVVTVGGTALLSAQQGKTVVTLMEYDSPNVALFSVAVFVLFRYVLGVSEERSRRQRLGGIAKISFGIYLVHELFLLLLRHFEISTLSFLPALSVPLLSAGIFLCSCVVAWVLSKIPVLGRYLT